MAFFFIPAGVSIINYFDVLKNAWLQLILVCVLSTVITFAVTAWTVRLTMRLTAGFRMKDQREEKKND